MNPDQRLLLVLRVTAALAIVTGLAMSGLQDASALYGRKMADARELAAMRQRAHDLRAIVAERTREAGPAATVSELLQAALPGHAAVTRELDPTPTLPGWTARRVSVALSDVTGDELGRLFQEAAKRRSWALLECTLLASSTPGRLTKAELVLGTVERTAGSQP